jgi:hypothetical protein
MSVTLSYAKHISESLKRAGYTLRWWRHGILGTRVYERSGQVIVVIPTIEISPSFIQPISQSMDEYFKKLHQVLIGLRNKFNISDLFLPGGGGFSIPDWFKEWCNLNGINLHIIDLEGHMLRDVNFL